MDSIDKLYLQKEKTLIKYYASKLLCELIELNYEFSNKEYNGANGESIYKILERSMKFKGKDKKEVIKTATELANLKYRVKVVDFDEFVIEKER